MPAWRRSGGRRSRSLRVDRPRSSWDGVTGPTDITHRQRWRKDVNDNLGLLFEKPVHMRLVSARIRPRC
jgi:hypothetical protein